MWVIYMKHFKSEDVEILAPTIRKLKLPCAIGMTCLNAYCKRRTYTLNEKQMKALESVRNLEVEIVPNICDNAKCRKRLYPKFIRLSFCIKAICPHLDLEHTQCKLKPKPICKVITFEKRQHTLRMHRGSEKGALQKAVGFSVYKQTRKTFRFQRNTKIEG